MDDGWLSDLFDAGTKNVSTVATMIGGAFGGAFGEVGETARAGIAELGLTARSGIDAAGDVAQAGIDEAGDVAQVGIGASALALAGTAAAYAGILVVPGLVGMGALAVDWLVFNGKGTKAALKLIL